MIKQGYLWGLQGNVKGTEKQRGSGECSASEDIAAKNISESRMHEQNNNGRRQYG